MKAYNAFCKLLMDLGFQLGHTKLVPPTLNLVFLGVEIDTVESSLSLPHSEQTDLEALNAPFFLVRRL